jgi:hypothetical protein
MGVRIDRSLVGVILIAIVVSTLITLFLIGEGGEYSIVKNVRPNWAPQRTGETYSFALTMVVNSNLGSMKIRHFCLINRTDKIVNISKSGTPEEIAKRIPEIEAYLGATGNDPSLVDVSVHDVEIWEHEYELHLYDFSRVVWSSVPETIMKSTNRPRSGIGFLWDFYDTFAVLLDKEGELSRFYQGVADFFLQKVISVKELSVEINEEKEVYFGATTEEVEGASSIFNAPPRGVLVFEDIGRNDVIGVLFQVDGGGVPSSKGLLHITSISVDEASPEYIDSPM